MRFAVFGIEKMLSGVKTRRTSPSTTFHLVYSRGFTLLLSLLHALIIPPILPNAKRDPSGRPPSQAWHAGFGEPDKTA